MKNTDAKNRLAVLLAGLTSKRFLLITKSFYVYDLPRSSIENVFSELNMDAKPVPLSDKYPVLYKDVTFQKFVANPDLIFNSFTIFDGVGEYLSFTIKNSDRNNDPNLRGIVYDINDNKVLKGYTYNMDYPQVLLSLDTEKTFYALRNKNGLEINLYQLTSQVISDNVNQINEMGGWTPVCLDSTGKTIFIANDSSGCDKAQWPILNGFVNQKYFYLFGDTYIFVFDADIYKSPGSKSKLTQLTYVDFFLCNGDASGKSGKLWWGFVWIQVVLLFFFRFVPAHHHDHHNIVVGVLSALFAVHRQEVQRRTSRK